MSSQQPPMSRRDWFRLRPPATQTTQQTTSQQRLGGERHAGMQSIEEPVNHGGVDLTALPPMHEATLDAKEVMALFADIERHATGVTLISRSAVSNGSDQAEKLSLAGERLLRGDVQKMQIRYQWETASWIDTLQRRANGFHLVRIQHGSGQHPGQP